MAQFSSLLHLAGLDSLEIHRDIVSTYKLLIQLQAAGIERIVCGQ